MTKPAITPVIWATDANYTTGPAVLIGTPNKISLSAADLAEGWNGNEIPPAQWTNWLLNHVTQWTNYVALSSATADIDDTIVQRNTDGRVALAALTLGGTTSADYPLDIQETNSGNSERAINVELTTDAHAAYLTGDSDTRTVLSVTQLGDQTAASFTGNGNGNAVSAVTGGDGSAYVGLSNVAGSNPTMFIGFIGGGTPVRGHVNWSPKPVASAPVSGDMGFYDASTPDTGTPTLWFYNGTNAQRVWATPGGFGRFKVESLASVDTSSTSFVGTGVSGSFGAANEPIGEYDVIFSGAVSLATGSLPAQAEIQYSIGGVVAMVERVEFHATIEKKTFFLERTLNHVGGGSVQVDIQFRALNGANTIRFEEGRIRVQGAY